MSVNSREEGRTRLVGSVEDVALALDGNRDEVYELIRENEIDSFLDGRRRKIVWASVDAYVARRLKASKQKQFERLRYPARGPDGTTIQTGIGAKPAAAQSEAVPLRKRSGVTKNGIPAQGAE
jgi:hypothetical protein